MKITSVNNYQTTNKNQSPQFKGLLKVAPEGDFAFLNTNVIKSLGIENGDGSIIIMIAEVLHENKIALAKLFFRGKNTAHFYDNLKEAFSDKGFGDISNYFERTEFLK